MDLIHRELAREARELDSPAGHGDPQLVSVATKDLDLWVEPTLANATRSRA